MTPSTAWVQTYTGRRVDLFDPRLDQIDIEDIAHALSMQCRFNGHTRDFYSVAQHSVIVSMTVPPRLAFAGLMHDAAEAYTGDLVRPLKRALPQFKEAERAIWEAICQKWALDAELAPEVREADLRALATEARDLLPGGPCEPWSALEGIEPFAMVIAPQAQSVAKRLFLHAFHSLTGDHTFDEEARADAIAARVVGAALRKAGC